MFNKQKKHFKSKLTGVQRMVWDLEFKRFKTREIREEVRQTYDNQKSRQFSLKEQLNNKELKKEELANIKDEIERLDVQLKRYEEQMKGLDLEVEGSKPTNELPDGHDGINQTLDSLRELQQMIKSYIDEL